MQAVILAAGQGLRLRPFTEHSPKALVPVNNQPLLFHTLKSLPQSISEIIIVVGYLGDQIVEAIGDSYNGVPISYAWQKDLLGTGDALLCAKDLLKDKFLVINGDDLYRQSDLEKLIVCDQSILTWESQEAYEFGLKVADNKLIGFDENSKLKNCGAYVLKTDFFNQPLVKITVHDKTEYSLPHTLINLAETEDITAVPATFWFPIGTPTQLEFANSYLSRQN
jgi:NDP-sugar pyrophosphorylase family protein